MESQLERALPVVAVWGGWVLGALLLATLLADRPIKRTIVQIGMFALGASIFVLGFVNIKWIAFPLIMVIGCSVMIQFNTTNTLFQLLSPDRLRGRVMERGKHYRRRRQRRKRTPRP